MNFTIGTEIYDHLEKVVDRFEDVANEINGIVIEHALTDAHDGPRPQPAGPDRPDRGALLFDFLNGLHDAANSIATIVSTRVLRPRYAVVWAAFFNFIAFLFFGLHVAQTIGTGIVDGRHRRRARDLRRADGRDLSGTSSPGGSASRRAARTR